MSLTRRSTRSQLPQQPEASNSFRFGGGGLSPPLRFAWSIQMSSIHRTRTVLIREDTQLPTMLSIESEAFLPGWRVVKDLDRQALTREVEGANWHLFYLAGEMRATVFGRAGLGALRR